MVRFEGNDMVAASGYRGWRSQKKLKSFDLSNRNSDKPLPFVLASLTPPPVRSRRHQVPQADAKQATLAILRQRKSFAEHVCRINR